MRYYTANKGRYQGRKAYSIIFRHPVINDSKGARGLRVRRGLSTANAKMADILVGQMNDLLKNEFLWNLDARHTAEKLYNPIIIAAFYEPLEKLKEISFIIVYESGLGKGWDIIKAINAKDALKRFKELEPDIYRLCRHPYGKIYLGKMEKVNGK